MLRLIAMAVVGLSQACGGSASGPTCDLAVTIDSATACTWHQNPDPFENSWWSWDFTGTARGPPATDTYSTQLAVAYESMLTDECQMSCASWTGGANFTCAPLAGQPAASTWVAHMQYLPRSSETSANITVTATVSGIGQTPCRDTPPTAARTVSCTR